MNDDPPDPYKLKDESVRKPRYRPMPGANDAPRRDPDDEEQRPERWWMKLSGRDPVPVMLIISLLLWAGLGLLSKQWHWAGTFIIGWGVFLIIFAEIWLLICIYSEDRDHFFWSMLSSWYKAFYLRMNPEVGFPSFVLTFVGGLMVVTGSFSLLRH